jgi:hypothetical protein
MSLRLEIMFKALTKGNNSLRSNRFPFVNWHIISNPSDMGIFQMNLQLTEDIHKAFVSHKFA